MRDQLSDAELSPSLRDNVDDAAELLASVLAASETLHYLVATADGMITACNPAMARALLIPETTLAGSSLWEQLAEADGRALRERFVSRRRSPAERFPLSFTSGPEPFTLSCWVDFHPTHITIVGELAPKRDAGYDEELFGLNNELAVLARESARRGKELDRAKAKLQETLDELQRTHWHLRKISEVLPMCVECGKVKPGEGEWENVADYLRENSLFLSHGCCPACMEKLEANLGVGSTA